MTNNRSDRFDKIRNKIENKPVKKKKNKSVEKEQDGNTFMSEAYPIIVILCIIVCFGFFYYLFNSYKKVLVVDNTGYFISSDTLILGSKKTKVDKDIIKFISVEENDIIYKNALNHYVDNSKEERINIQYPLFIDNGLSFINYNEDTNLINHEFERVTGYSGLILSYGRAFDSFDYTQIDQEKYLLLSYSDDVMINLYDLKIKTFANEYVIPVNSFIFFEEKSISYYERTKDAFKYKTIKDIDFKSTLDFLYESANEHYEYDYEKFLRGIDTVYIKEFVVQEDVTPENPEIEVIPPKEEEEEEKEEIVKPEFIWEKPSVTIYDLKPSVYSLKANIKITDNARVIVKEPTFTFYRNNKTFLRRTYYTTGEMKVTGLVPSTTFTLVGTYTYLAEDLETRISVTFFRKEITTNSLDSLSAVDFSFENGQVYPKKIAINDVMISSDLSNEALSGVNKIALNADDKVFYLSNNQVLDIINGKETLIESPESLESSSVINYKFDLLDREGNIIKSNNNNGTTRTSKRPPNVSLRVKNSEIDSVTIGVNIKNEDDIAFHNFMYIVKKSDGSIIKQENIVGDEIVLTNLDPDQLFNVTVFADFDIDDGNGIVAKQQMANMDFTSKPITTLGYVSLPMEIENISHDSVDISCNINTRKTNVILIKLIQRLKFDIYDETETLIDSILVDGDEITKLKEGNQINILFNNLSSFTKYKIVVTTIIQQGSTIYELGTTQGLEEFMTNKLPARVNITNPFTTETMIDFDVSIEDIDDAIESDFVRLELRDKDQRIVNTKRIAINADPERITYNNLNTNEFYNIYVYADGYNETNLSSNYKSKYLMFNKAIYTETGISGKIELVSSLRVPTGKNIVDVKSEVKWLQMYQYYNVPKTVDEDGNLHIYSKTSSSAYTYNLSDYHGEIVTASFKIKAITPVNPSYKVYFTQYISGTTSTAYSKALTGLSTEEYKEFKFTFRVGSYSSLSDISNIDKVGALFTPCYSYTYGQNYTDGAGFYINGGTGIMSEYVIKDFEIHVQYDKEEYDYGNVKLENGTFSSTTTYKATKVNNDYYVRSSDFIYLKGGQRYSFEYNDPTNTDYDIIFYLFKTNGTYEKSYGWSNTEYSFYIDSDRYVRILFRYKDANGTISYKNIHDFKIYTYTRNDVTSNPEYKYELVTKAKVELTDKRDEIATNDYYIKIYENGEEYKSYNYVELEDKIYIENEIKRIELEEKKNYIVELGIVIRDRYYALSNFELSTADEVLGISTNNEWVLIQPYGNYILLNDLDFTNLTDQRIGWGYRYFHGVIDFQGYTVKDSTTKTDGSTKTAYNRMYRIESDAVLKNLVLDVNLNNQDLNSEVYGFLRYNYGTIENVVINITDTKETQMPQKLYGLLAYYNGLKGKVKNFVVNLKNELHYYAESAVLIRENYGLIENGYMYGSNVVVDFPLVSGTARGLGILNRYNSPQGKINRVFTTVSYDFPNNNLSYDFGGIISYSNSGIISNSYVVGDANPLKSNVGPVTHGIGATSRMDNVFYLSDNIYTSSVQSKASYASLHDNSFQYSVLGDGFNIDEMIALGYYPQVKYSSNKMPAQDFIELPETSEDEYADIIYMETISNDIDSAKIKVLVDNPMGEEITEIIIANLTTTIESQTFSDGRSEVIITVSKPAVYVSKYQVDSITTTSPNGYKSTKKYQKNELFLKVDLYRKIYTVQDFINIKKYSSQNFILMNDLDFFNYSNYYISSFTGVFDGNNYKISNINITSSSWYGLFGSMNGTLRNVTFENIYKTGKVAYHGIVGNSNSNARFYNVHVNNITFEIKEDQIVDTMRIGALVGQASQSSISYCSATDVLVRTSSESPNFNIGGLIGRGAGIFVSNSFVQDVDIVVENAISTQGVGGILGYETNSETGTIEACYSTGKITTNTVNIGGIAGNDYSYIRDCYSTVDLVSDMSHIGGIAGNTRQSTNAVETSLYLGNIYSASTDRKYVNRISANYESHVSNYAMDTNLINGLTTTKTKGENLLKYEDFFKSETYEMIFKGEPFDYSQSDKGILPKLYAKDGKELLPYQKDNYLYKNEFNIRNLVIKKFVDYASVVLNLENPNNYQIEEIKIEDAFSNVQRNVTENGVTQIELEIRPDKYFDSYRISQLVYKDNNGEVKTVDRNIKLDAIFYKPLRNYDDWQAISTSIAENYKISNDIDFYGKTNIKTNVMFNRLESLDLDEEKNPIEYTIKNIKLNYTTNGNYRALIQKVSTLLQHVNFEGITITDTSTSENSYINVIMYNYGTIYNVDFDNITINAPKKNYVAPIGRNYGYQIDNVTVNKITASGKHYTSGFVAYAENSVNDKFQNITGTNLDIKGTTHSVGGLFGMYSTTVNSEDNPKYLNMTVKDSKIYGTAYYAGGVVGYGDCSYCHVDNVTVTGNYYVGGVVGHYRSAYQYGNLVENSHVSGTAYYIGGVYGNQYYVYDMHVKNTTVEGLKTSTHSIGGISGYRSGYGIMYRCGVLDSTINNKGDRAGGLIGRSINDLYIRFSYVDNTNITAANKAGGGIGEMQSYGYFEYNKISNTNVVANNYYAGGIVGYYNNDGAYGSYTEGYVREDSVENVNVQADHYAGGFFGGVNADIYYAAKIRKLYFDGTITTNSGNNVGLGSGDKHNLEVLKQPRIYYYNNSTLNGVEIKNLAESSEISQTNLIEGLEYLPGYITGGIPTYNENDVNALYSDFIRIEDGKTYLLDIDYINIPDSYRVYLYTDDYQYVSEITSSSVDSYIDSYGTTSYYDEFKFSAYKNCYLRINITNKNRIRKIELKEIILPTVVEKNQLLDAGQIREELTWVDSTSTTTNMNASRLFFSRSYWNASSLDYAHPTISVTDKTSNKYVATGKVASISSDGVTFDARANNQQVFKVNNYVLPSNNVFTVSTKFSTYSSRGYSPVFSVARPSTSSLSGFGIFTHWMQIYILINGSYYSTGYYVPYVREVDVSVTYQNRKVSLYVDGEFIKTINTTTMPSTSGYETHVGYNRYYNSRSSSYNFVGRIQNVKVFNRILDANEIKNNYNSSGITNTNNLHLHYDFTSTEIDYDSYYPLVKTNTSVYPLQYQRNIPMPKYATSRIATSTIAGFGLNTSMINQYINVYSSGIDTINLEFSEIGKDLSFIYRINGEEYKSNVDKKVYSLQYDYLSDIEIEISNAYESKLLKYSAKDLTKKINSSNGNYYYIDDENVLYKNDTKLIDDCVHMYGSLVLLNSGKLYDIENGNILIPYIKKGILNESIALSTSILNGKVINTYYNFTMIDNEELEGQLFIKNSHAYMFDSNNTLNDNIVYNMYNTEEYQIILNRSGSLSSYKANIRFPKSFVNNNIKEITFDKNSNKTIIMIRYDSSNVLAFDYITGEEVFRNNKSMNISLFEYISSTLSEDTSLLNVSSSEYKDSKKFINSINQSSDKINDALSKLSISDNSTSNILDTEYISVYNSKTNKFNIYNVNELITSKNESMIKDETMNNPDIDLSDKLETKDIDISSNKLKVDVEPINSKIKSNFELYEYFYNNDKTLIKDRKTIIYCLIIGFIIVNLFMLSYTYGKKERYEK